MKSALDHPEVVTKYIAEKVAAGRVLGPFTMESSEIWLAYQQIWCDTKATPSKSVQVNC